MPYFHDTLLHYGFTQQREDFYIRETDSNLGGTLFCSVGEGGRPRKLLLWQAQRVLLQGDVVTRAALRQVLDRVLQRKEDEPEVLPFT